MKIIYFHGFASTGVSPKVDTLREKFPKADIVAPNLPTDPSDVIDLIDSIIKENNTYPIIFLGTSLGGFYANYFSLKYDCPCFLINPSTEPSERMLTRIGIDIRNYVTGEKIEIKQEHIQKFIEMEKFIKEEQCGALIYLFLAKDDETLPYERALENIPFTKSTIVMNDGGHRFNKHWHLVCNAITEYSKL